MKRPNWTIAAFAAAVLAAGGLRRAQMPSEPPASNSHVPGGVINPSSGAGDAMIARRKAATRNSSTRPPSPARPRCRRASSRCGRRSRRTCAPSRSAWWPITARRMRA